MPTNREVDSSSAVSSDSDDVPLSDYDKVLRAITRLKNKKDVGADGLPAELFKPVGDELKNGMQILMSKIWSDESMPSDWHISVLCPFDKKGDPNCTNYLPFVIMMFTDAAQASNLDDFANSMYMALTQLGLLAKLVNNWCNTKLLIGFFAEFTEDPLFQSHNAEERREWSPFVSVLFSPQCELPFPYAPPFNWCTKPNYWYAYFYELLASVISCSTNSSFDMINSYMLLQLSLYFKLICGRLERMGELEGDASMKGFSEEKFRIDFCEVTRLDARTKQLTQKCEQFVSFPFFIQMFCSAFVLCFSAYRLQKLRISENPSPFVAFIQVLLIMGLQIFIPCFYGSELMKYSSELNNAMYSSAWFQCSPGMRKYLVIYMEMLQRPVRVRAANLFDINLDVFKKTMGNTYSLLALLLNMNN
ncbi:odorant receptor 94b-like [Anastrepha obliqua]|uniref:odorant receptor 94b-like n=1 Tax=Anastrepha obliqua TaxID=95512 RepID=UPI0024099D61|nr:odorant receptor 94b-like [Anastrepha obliqua]